MAAFFALNTTQFRHDEQGSLELAYVTDFMYTPHIYQAIFPVIALG